MPGKGWLISEGTTLDAAAIRGIERTLAPSIPGGRTRGGTLPQLAIRFHDIVIHDNRKWWGGADIRIDVLVVHGNGAAGQAESFYQPTTFRFPRVKDGERLPIDGGLLVFYGRPQHFVDIAITVSRDRKDSADLATLLKDQAGNAEVKGSLDALLGLAIAAPEVALVTGAIKAAATLAELGYRIVASATSETIGLYRASWLQHTDGFGLGRHPGNGMHRVNDLSFWYAVERDEPAIGGP